MCRVFKYLINAMIIVASFLILNISLSNDVIRAENPDNPENYSFSVDGVLSSTNDFSFYYVNSNIVTLLLDERIIDNPDVKDIVILEYDYGYSPTVIERGDENFSSTITYTMRNIDREFKNIQIVLLTDYDVEAGIPTRWISTMQIYVYQVDPLVQGSYYISAGQELNRHDKYDINISYVGDKIYAIDTISYVDPFNVLYDGLEGDYFEVSEGGTYVFTITDIFGSSANYMVLVGYGRIDEVLISSNDLSVTLGVPETMHFELDIIGQGVSILDNMDDNLSVQWYVDGILIQNKTLGNNGDLFSYNNFPNSTIDDLRNYKVLAKVTTKISNELTFEVINNESPIVSLIGSTPIYLEANIDEYVESGATATDDLDANIANSIIVDYSSFKITGLGKVLLSDIDSVEEYLADLSNNVGRFTVRYQAHDSTGNYSTIVTRVVYVRDSQPPVITLNGNAYVELEFGVAYTELGASAYDSHDGDLTSQIEIFSSVIMSSSFINDEQEVLYSVHDSSGNYGYATRIVKYIDTQSPIITIIGNNPIHLEYLGTYIERGASVTDNVDGTFNIQRSSISFVYEGQSTYNSVESINTALLGTYYITYSYTDSSGNPAIDVIRTVYIEDTTAPVISLIDDDAIYIIARESSTYSDPGYSAIDNYDGVIDVNVTYSDVIDTTTSGEYVVYYNAVDAHGNAAIEVTRNVTILDTDRPIIYLNGSMNIVYEAFSELDSDDYAKNGIYGYTIDDSQPDIIPTVTIYDENMLPVPGICTNITTDLIPSCISTTDITTFTIVYSAIDDSSNVSQNNPAREVSIVDTTKPIITLIGSTEIERPIGYNLNTLLEELAASNLVMVSDQYDDYHGLFIEIEVINYIDVQKTGTYRISYTAEDSNGNIADPVDVRVVIIRDYAEPELTLIGSSSLNVERGETYVENGAYSIDIYDGTIRITTMCQGNNITGLEALSGHSGCIVYSPSRPTGMNKGTFSATFYSKDSSGNLSTPIIKTINVIDTTAPIVSGLEDDKIYYNYNLYITFEPNEMTDEVINATLNGVDIYSPISISEEGEYTLYLEDDFGNVTEIFFILDKTAPRILGITNDAYTNQDVTISSNEVIDTVSYIFEGGSWVDINATSRIFEEEGTYQVRVRDLAENWSSILTFTIDKTNPYYTLYGVGNKQITNSTVTLEAEDFASITYNGIEAEENIQEFTSNNYYRIVITDRAGNTTNIQFTINKSYVVTINETATRITSQHNLDEANKVVLPQGYYSSGSGIIVVYPKLGGTFELVSFRAFSEYELSVLQTDDLEININIDTSDVMGAVFIADGSALNALKIYQDTDDPGGSGVLAFAGVAGALGVLVAIFMILKKRKKKSFSVDDYDDEVVEDESSDTYFEA